MKRLRGFIFCALTVLSAQADDGARVVLFGGSSVLTSYLPEDAKHRSALERLLRETYPTQKIEVENWADNGEFVARYLLKGAYEKQRRDQAGIDIAIIRFGTNDQKRVKVPEYYVHLKKLIALLKEDFPGVAIVMETGMYVDFPKHFSGDRNKTLQPYWNVSRKIAAEDGYPLVDYYEAVKRATEAGHWDLRARARHTKEFILDASQDAGKENNPAWFTNFHPNPEGVRIAAVEEVKVLKAKFPTRLPTGQTAISRPARNQAHYVGYLNFTPDRLVLAGTQNPDKELQDAKP